MVLQVVGWHVRKTVSLPLAAVSARWDTFLPAKTACERAAVTTYTYIHSTTDDRVRTDERACCRMFYFLESRSTLCVLGRVSSEWKVDKPWRRAHVQYIFWSRARRRQRWQGQGRRCINENERGREKKREMMEMRGGIHGLGMPSRLVFPVKSLLDLPDSPPSNVLLLYAEPRNSTRIWLSSVKYGYSSGVDSKGCYVWGTYLILKSLKREIKYRNLWI